MQLDSSKLSRTKSWWRITGCWGVYQYLSCQHRANQNWM